MTVYLDVVFFENVFMNFCILYSTSIFNNKKNSLYRMAVGAIIGALYYVAILLPQTYFLSYSICKIILSLLIIAISFKYTDIYSFIHDLVVFLIVSCIFGGVMYGIYFYIFNKLTIPYYPIKLLMFGTITIVVLLRISIHRIRCNLDYRRITYSIQIMLDGKVKIIRGFLDTGNSLKDPITNKPVLLVNYNSIKELLPNEICNVCKNNLNSLSNLSKENESRVRLLPYISVGNQNGLMLGYKMDKITIYLNKEKNIVLDNALVGINTTSLNAEHSFDALLSIELLELQRGNEEWEKCNLKN